MIVNATLNELDKIISKIKKSDKNIVLLQGDLASGKTTLVKKFVKSIGLSDDVTSPTFSIMNIYGDGKVYHYDIYGNGIEKFLENGLMENLEEDGYHFVEWADEKFEKILKDYGFSFLKIKIVSKGTKKREYIFYEA